MTNPWGKIAPGYVSSVNLTAKTRNWLNRIALYNRHEMRFRWKHILAKGEKGKHEVAESAD